jgi:hypothetical protein
MVAQDVEDVHGVASIDRRYLTMQLFEGLKTLVRLRECRSVMSTLRSCQTDLWREIIGTNF